MAVGKKTGGRKAGVPNKLTQSAKDAFQLAFDDLGGWEGLAKWAKKDDDNRKVFYGLYSKLIPQDVNANVTTTEVEFK
jgi:hypothetical protein